ncbi:MULTISPECIES: beta-ketoacyl-ACP synthase 3 [unclassified Streptomyces]|uniref:beta-ketoacyl-ACP synthase 3 n=1 Tax=unclassified Streptomyces TaxID=2593676 RepID=UPI00352EE8C4
MVESVAGWVPPWRVTNDALPAHWGVDDHWVRSRTGITARHRSGPGVSTGDLAYEAARLLLERAGHPRVDALVLATATPDHPCPATAPAVAARLGLGSVGAVDVSAVCSGFIYGLACAQGLVAAGIAERVLLAGADTYSGWLDPDDHRSGVVFGDGAGAALVAAGPAGAPGELLGFDLGSDGAGHDLISVAGGGSRARSSQEQAAPGDGYFRMRGGAVYQQAVERMTGSCRALLAKLGWDPGQVDHFVPHQANGRILSAVAERLGIDPARCVIHLDRVGNTGAASIPLALADADARGALRTGDRVLLTAFGGGLTWGSAALRWAGPPVAPAAPAAVRATASRSPASRTTAVRPAAAALSEELS